MLDAAKPKYDPRAEKPLERQLVEEFDRRSKRDEALNARFKELRTKGEVMLFAAEFCLAELRGARLLRDKPHYSAVEFKELLALHSAATSPAEPAIAGPETLAEPASASPASPVQPDDEASAASPESVMTVVAGRKRRIQSIRIQSLNRTIDKRDEAFRAHLEVARQRGLKCDDHIAIYLNSVGFPRLGGKPWNERAVSRYRLNMRHRMEFRAKNGMSAVRDNSAYERQVTRV